MKNKVAFQQVDVFTTKPYRGNPVAVVMDGDQLTTQQMQQIANWCHLSETTFVCSPTNSQADYRLRIFSPQHELPFAGHPTIGSAKAVLNSGLIPKNKDYLVQECGKGLVKIYIKRDQLFLTLPQPQKKVVSPELLKDISKYIGFSDKEIKLSEIIDVGAVWVTLQLKNDQQVLNLNPNFGELGKVLPTGITGVTVFGEKAAKENTDFEVRSFVPNEGVTEDPVCGSGNGCVAIMIKDHKLLSKNDYTVSQGQKLGRAGRVRVYLDKNGEILVGGQAISCISGDILLPLSE